MTDQPTPDQIKQARKDAGLTQAEAANIVYVSLRAWQHYEDGKRGMPLANWNLFLLKTEQHPDFRLIKNF